MMLGFLLARAGVPVTVLEKHGDFLRDFRGDTVHPSTLRVMDDLGLLQAFLARPHDEVRQLEAVVYGQRVQVADFTRLRGLPCDFIALMPQWDFLDFLRDEAERFPHFRLLLNTEGLGLEEAGVQLDDGGFIRIDKVGRTTAPGVYAAGDCTGGFMLASVAAMAGRVAMRHFLGDAVQPVDLKEISSNVFTSPEIATVGWSAAAVEKGEIEADVVKLDLTGNARAKMQGITDGFVKLIARRGSGVVVGGVVVGPRASELIHPIALAVKANLTADQVANTFTVYPSLSGSTAEAARRLHRVD